MMDVFRPVLLTSTLLCSLVAGFLLAFALIVMPGLKQLPALDYLQVFKLMDRIIQNNHPLFILLWAGSMLTLALSLVLGWSQLDALGRALLTAGALVYFLGVQAPTLSVNVPLNNQVQAQSLEALAPEALTQLRRNFESRWVFWNTVRTVMAIFTAVLLLILVLRL